MTADQLHGFKNKVPFRPLTIHMTDSEKFSIPSPEDLFTHPDWSVDAIVLHPRGRFPFICLRTVASVSSERRWPKVTRRRGRGRNGDN